MIIKESINKNVYLADDDDDDRFLICEAIKSILPTINIIEVTDGRQLLDKIIGANAKSPALILLDMNMPRMNGLEAAIAIRSNPSLAEIPLAMITTSSDKVLSAQAYKCGVDRFFIKPSSFEGLIKMARELISQFLHEEV